MLVSIEERNRFFNLLLSPALGSAVLTMLPGKINQYATDYKKTEDQKITQEIGKNKNDDCKT